MSLITKALWDTELADIPMPEGASYMDYHKLVVEKQRYTVERDQMKFIDGLRRLAAQNPLLKESIATYIAGYCEHLEQYMGRCVACGAAL
jgi:hypothetical protein